VESFDQETICFCLANLVSSQLAD